nr:hypothetical protein [Candidatus Sigynarchaeota archaeon]
SYITNIEVKPPQFTQNMIVHFKAHQRFTSRGKYKDLVYSIDYNDNWYQLSTQMVYSQLPIQSPTSSMQALASIWHEKGIDISTPDTTQIVYSVQQLKTILQDALTKTVRYTGRNNRDYQMFCKPSVNSINILDYYPFWNQSSEVIISCGGERREYSLEDGKSTQQSIIKEFICADCERIKSIKEIRFCRNCGKVLCTPCMNYKPFLHFFRRYWCDDCYSLLSDRKITEEKSTVALDTLRKCKEWLKSSTPPVEAAPDFQDGTVLDKNKRINREKNKYRTLGYIVLGIIALYAVLIAIFLTIRK